MSTPLLPTPRIPLTVRPATAADLPFIDSLQKQHSKQVGWMPTKSLEQRVAAGELLVASASSPSPIGYVIATDRSAPRPTAAPSAAAKMTR